MRHYRLMLVLFFALFAMSCERNDQVLNSDGDSSNTGVMANSGNDNGGAKKIVVLKHGADKARFKEFAKENGLSVDADLDIINGMAVSLPSNASSKAFEAIIKHMDVELIEDDIQGFATQTTTQNKPWGIDRVDFDLAWPYSTGAYVKVGIIDSGIDRDHPDLVGNLGGGVNFVSGVSTYEDDNGHGTHVAGTVAAVNNTLGVVGGATRAKIYAIKALNSSGSCYTSQIISSLQWSMNNGMQVLNMSLGFGTYSSTLHTAIKNAVAKGIVIVAAAGNNSGAVMYPAKFPEVIAVSSVDKYNKLSTFSSRGPEIDVAAPGSSVYSTKRGNTYGTMSGTSMASPHVAALAALIKAKYPTATPAQVMNHIKRTAENLGLSSYYQGAGLIDAEKAVRTALY